MRLRAGRLPLAAAGLALPLAAFAFEDAATGFRVTPPPPFVVEPVDGDPRVDVKLRIRSRTGKPTALNPRWGICIVNFGLRRSPEPITKAELGTVTENPRRPGTIRESLSASFDFSKTELFELQGYRGVELQGQFTRTPDLMGSRTFVSIVDSVKGRTMMNCTTPDAEFDEALPQFRAIRASIALPE